jgi:hypothetical protein
LTLKNNNPTFDLLWQTRRVLRTWKAIKEGLKKADARDCLDYLEFDLLAEEQIKLIRKSVISGSYAPSTAGAFQLAKSQGAYRVMSILTAQDALIFRHLVDSIYRVAQVNEPVGAFFAQSQPTVPIGPQLRTVKGLGSDFYESAWTLWINYHQYRTRTLLNTIRPVLVVTDITNYFESIQHELLIEYLSPLGLPRKTIGLLGKLLARFKPDSGYSPTPGVGLPVDQHDCSRALAHIFLFEHDRRVTSLVGKDNHARWMDDQNAGVASSTHARRLVRRLTESLSQQRLVLNAGKTKFLSPDEVNLIFHLDANQNLDQIAKAIETTTSENETKDKLLQAWTEASRFEHKGHWDKILKRFYAAAGRLRMDFLEQRAMADLIAYPLLAARIFEYFSALQDYQSLLTLFQTYVRHGESLYESVEAAFFENILLSNIPNSLRTEFRQTTTAWLQDDELGSGRPYSRGVAALCLYWLGDKRSVPTIRRLLRDESQNFQATTVRALVAAYVALAPQEVDEALKISARFSNPEIGSFAQFIERIQRDEQLQCTLKKISPRRPYSSQVNIFEARSWIRLEILTLAKSMAIKRWLKVQQHQLSRSALGDCEQRVYQRWQARL